MKSDQEIIAGLIPGSRMPAGWIYSLSKRLRDRLHKKVLTNNWRFEKIGDEIVIIAGKPTEAIIELEEKHGSRTIYISR